MNCKNCGTQLGPQDKECPACGTAASGVAPQPAQEMQAPVQDPNLQPNMNGVGTINPVGNEVPTQAQPEVGGAPVGGNVQPPMEVNPMDAQLGAPVPPMPPVQEPQTPVAPVPPMQPEAGGVQPMNPNPGMAPQPMNQMNMNAPAEKPGKDMKTKIAIGIVIAVLAVSVIIGVIVGLKISSSLNRVSVEFDGYAYKIPTKYEYKTDDNYLRITDKDETWEIGINTMETSYSDMLKEIEDEEYLDLYEELGLKNIKQETVNGRKYITMEITSNDEKAIVAYTELDKDTVYFAALETKDEKFDYSLLIIADSIISSAKEIEEK